MTEQTPEPEPVPVPEVPAVPPSFGVASGDNKPPELVKTPEPTPEPEPTPTP